MPPSTATPANDLTHAQSNGAGANAQQLAAKANDCLARGDIAGMRQHLAAASKVDPADPSLAVALGHAELNLGDLNAALTAYSKAAELGPTLPSAHSSRALVLQLLGRSTEAALEAKHTLTLSPGEPVALKVLARIHLNAGDRKMAQHILRTILDRNPADADALQMIEQSLAMPAAPATPAAPAPENPAAPQPLAPPPLPPRISDRVAAQNPYTRMQKSHYEQEADQMNRDNHMFHNGNQDYWDILVSDTESNFRDKVGLDFGSGCGRNVMNLWMRFRRMDGADISAANIRHARNNILKCGCPADRFQLFEVSGVDLGPLRSEEYDFVMSTIVLQHIAVHDIRFGLLKEFFRVLKPGGLLSFQMGFGEGYGKAGYYDNHYDAAGTNSAHDTRVTDPEQIAGELRQLGFVNVRHVLRSPYSDLHPQWIFVKAEKPGGAVSAPQRTAIPMSQSNGAPAAHGLATYVSPPKAPAKPALTAQDYSRERASRSPSERQESWVFFDVGANNGFTSVPVAQQHPHAHVYAFEPTPQMVQQIETKAGNLPNYHLTRKAVSDFNGKAKFKVAGQSDWGCSSLLDFSDKSRTEWPGRNDFVVTEQIEVDVMRLDAFIEEQGIETIDFLHIDTQGSDLKVLQGLGKYLSIVKQGAMEAAARPDILYKGQNTQEESIRFLQENGFEILGVDSNDDRRNEVNIYFKRKTKIRQYIVTYNNQKQINNCLRSIFRKSSPEELAMLEVFVINNHTSIKIDDEFLPRIKLLNNSLRPNFSTGHLARSWNQALVNGFKNLRAPDCDLIITNQDDTLFVDNYLTKTLELHKQYDFVQFGWGDNFISYTPRAVKRVGLWDEKFCNIGYQEADYMTRARLLLKEKACINDFSHKRMFNAIDKSRYVIDIIPSGNARGEDYNHTSIRFHDHSKFMYELKWGVDPDLGWENVDVERLKPKTQQYVYYPYFEKDVETLDEQNYLHRFPKRQAASAKNGAVHNGAAHTATLPVGVNNGVPYIPPAPIRNGSHAKPKPSLGSLGMMVFGGKSELSQLGQGKVTYQAAQFAHLDRLNPMLWRNSPNWKETDRLSDLQQHIGRKLDAAIVFDEIALLTDNGFQKTRWDTDTLLVFVTHDFWCHPLRVAEKLRQYKRVLMVLRHECAKNLFDRLLPGVPKVVQRPGVETSIFHPREGAKQYDILLGGSETPDYPIRQRLNRLVRENAARLGWKVLDQTGVGLMSNPPGSQNEYSAALAAAKVSPTGSNRGGGHGCKIVTQYFDLSAARAQYDHDFYGLKTPEVVAEQFDTAGITPRYLESLASKSLLIADIPPNDNQEWYRDKMVVVAQEMSDAELVETIDHWVRDDREREAVCERAWQAVKAGESSEHKAAELLELIQAHLK